jgi:hypothetical protein
MVEDRPQLVPGWPPLTTLAQAPLPPSFAVRNASDVESAQPVLPTDVLEAQEGERLRLSLSTLGPVERRKPAIDGAMTFTSPDSQPCRLLTTPFLWDSFIPDCTPVYPDVCALLRSWL